MTLEQRFHAVMECLGGTAKTEVAARYGVSRQPIHNWLARYAAEGVRRGRQRGGRRAGRRAVSGMGGLAGQLPVVAGPLCPWQIGGYRIMRVFPDYGICGGDAGDDGSRAHTARGGAHPTG
nr:helix-turn-helix domain-containing protein [Micromonospora sp. U21]